MSIYSVIFKVSHRTLTRIAVTVLDKFLGTVRMLLLKQIKVAFMHPQFQSDVLKPMNLENIMDEEVETLSGGELQRVAIVLALGRLF